jgi:hypothetical protein
VEGAHIVVFVDTLEGFAPPGRPVALDHRTVLDDLPAGYGHGGGLGYLLRMLPSVCGNGLPKIVLLGAEPPIEPDVVGLLADMALRVATLGAI